MAMAELRDGLLAELNDLGCGDDAAIWARRNLGAKDGLTAADAGRVEEAFRAMFATFADPAAADAALQTPTGAEHRLPPYHGLHPGELDQRPRAMTIDKSALAFPEPRRVRDRGHVKFVAKQACLICGRRPSDAHHLRFAQHPALGRKVSDQFTVPLCRGHHREVHRCGDEATWWSKAGVDAIAAARALWLRTHPLSMAAANLPVDPAKSVGVTDRVNARAIPRI